MTAPIDTAYIVRYDVVEYGTACPSDRLYSCCVQKLTKKSEQFVTTCEKIRTMKTKTILMELAPAEKYFLNARVGNLLSACSSASGCTEISTDEHILI